MERHSLATLEEAIRQSGEGELIDRCAPPTEAVTYLLSTLEVTNQVAIERLGVHAPEFSEQALFSEFVRNPNRVRAFIQALRASRIAEMLLRVG